VPIGATGDFTATDSGSYVKMFGVTPATVWTHDAADSLRHELARLSLTHGWVPVLVQLVSAAVLIGAIGWRSTRWRARWLPLALACGAALAFWAHFYIESVGVAGDPAPRTLWAWIAMVGFAVGVMVFGWRGARWWRRTVSVLAVPLCVLSSVFALNLWVGYFPTVHTAWNQLTAGPLPDETDRLTVTAMQLAGARPTLGVVVPVSISPRASTFAHRRELVYLPPAWFASNPPPQLPTVMMIGAELNTPADWIRAGAAVSTADEFAATHAGYAPVLVFVDPTGAFRNDTECVNGRRGNAADHLTKDVVPFVTSNFGVSRDPANWGVVGWSMGGTCALVLTVKHPDLFTAFVDVSGDLGPNTGTKYQTINGLFGGDADAWAAFDPTTIINRHGPYTGVSGWFDVAGTPTNVGMGEPNAAGNPEGQDVAANSLCALGRAHGIRCVVVAQAGKHDWPFAANAFASALPWLAGRLGTPNVPRVPLPGLTPAPPAARGPTGRAEAAGH
jgi:S-formylglutathione hydrolase FrmB